MTSACKAGLDTTSEPRALPAAPCILHLLPTRNRCIEILRCGGRMLTMPIEPTEIRESDELPMTWVQMEPPVLRSPDSSTSSRTSSTSSFTPSTEAGSPV